MEFEQQSNTSPMLVVSFAKLTNRPHYLPLVAAVATAASGAAKFPASRMIVPLLTE